MITLTGDPITRTDGVGLASAVFVVVGAGSNAPDLRGGADTGDMNREAAK